MLLINGPYLIGVNLSEYTNGGFWKDIKKFAHLKRANMTVMQFYCVGILASKMN